MYLLTGVGEQGTSGRFQRYVTIDAVAKHLGIEPDEAESMARLLDDAGLVRVGGGHSVMLEESGRQLLKIPAGRHPSKPRQGNRRPDLAR